MSGTDLAERIREVADPLIASGAPPSEVRRAVAEKLGIGVGGGGGSGTDFGGVPPKLCPYCGATGNGGHGGNCPNA